MDGMGYITLSFQNVNFQYNLAFQDPFKAKKKSCGVAWNLWTFYRKQP